MKQFYLLFSLLFCTGFTSFSQELNILTFYGSQPDMEVGFVPLTDRYPGGEHPEMHINPEYSGDIQGIYYHELDSEKRTKFLNRVNLKESDQIYIFKFSLDSVIEFQIKDLPLVVRFLSGYKPSQDQPLLLSDYQVGFEIDDRTAQLLEKDDSDIFIHAGDKNPFQTGNIKPLIWKKVEREMFPLHQDSLTKSDWFKKLEPGDVYHDSVNEMDFYFQNYFNGERLAARYFIIKKSNEVIYDQIYADSESTYLRQLDDYSSEPNQWTGKIFKDYPPFIFGFTGNSFGCPRIQFIDQSVEPVRIKCDNRH